MGVMVADVRGTLRVGERRTFRSEPFTFDEDDVNLFVDPACGKDVVLYDAKLGGRSSFAGGGCIPGEAFDPTSKADPLVLGSIKAGEVIEVEACNVSDRDVEFFATVGFKRGS